MRARVRGVLRSLEGLHQHDVYAVNEKESSRKSHEQSLGGRRMDFFSAMHFAKLTNLLERLEAGAPAAELLAVRGRILRLLGRKYEARRALERALALGPNAWAAGWLGELLADENEVEADKRFRQALSIDPNWEWPHLWRAAVRLNKDYAKECHADLDEFNRKHRGPMPLVYHIFRGNAHLALKNHKRAATAARLAVALDPASPAGYYLASLVYCHSGDRVRAHRYSDQARNLDAVQEGSHLHARFGVTVDWSRPKKYLKDLDDAINKFPKEPVLYAARAELARSPGLCLYDKALRDYRKAAELAPKCAWAQAVLARAQNLAESGGGLPAFNRAIGLCPSSGWMRAWRGAVWARLGDKKKALADLNRAIGLMPWYGQAYSWRGALFNKLGRYEEAARDLDCALRLEPGYSFSFFERFRARLACQDFAGAVADLNKAFQQDPKFDWIGGGGGGGGRDAGASEARALIEQERAIAALPGSGWPRAWRGYTYLRLGRPEQALVDLDQAIQQERSSGLILTWRAEALRASGQVEAALGELERAITLDDGLWNSFLSLAEIRSERGELEKALVAISRAAALAPTTVAVLLLKAEIERRSGKRAEAIADLMKAVELHPQYPLIYVRMAMIFLENQNARAALKSAQRALELPAPPALAYVARGMARGLLDDHEGRIADFNSALAADPTAFSGAEKNLIESLVQGSAH